MSRRIHALVVVGTAMALLWSSRSCRAELVCSESVVDKGETRNGLPLSHRFRFVNRGTDPVEITDVRPSCGCLAPKVDRRIVPPGESGELLLEINTLTQPAGVNGWRATIRYRDGNGEKELPLYVRACLVSEISVEPPSLAIYTDASLGHEITVIDRRTEPLIVRAVLASSPYVRTRLGEMKRDDSGRWRRSIGVEVLADCPEGTHEETLRICTSDPLYTELKLPFTIVKRVRQQTTAAPASVIMTAAGNEPLPARVVLLSAADDREVRIDRVEADHEAVVCRWAQGPGHQATLKIRVERNRIPGDRLRAYVRVHLSQPAETILIPVSCLLR
jgi:hypothetical protein